MASPAVAWQPSLLAGAGGTGVDPCFGTLRRHHLPPDAWVDHVPAWVSGADDLFAMLVESVPWVESSRWMYERRVLDPRLHAAPGAMASPPSVVGDMVAALSHRYGVALDRLGANLYRDGRDSVAWHGDRIARDLAEAVVAIVSLGAPRRFRLRPKGGGPSIGYQLHSGDLLVMGGSCQRTWDHSVPKMAAAGARMSITFRHASDG